MTIRDEIDALPRKPKFPGVNASYEEKARYYFRAAGYERAHREMAERLLRMWMLAQQQDSMPPLDSTRAYFAKREAE
ncbi:MAG: hypothetical protein AB7F22_30185 [Reyranella sp.]|uniref:hypothetical protein n=1 Tax=Reyranella sp. TaxID=1929291 RepID=UPI003D110208